MLFALCKNSFGKEIIELFDGKLLYSMTVCPEDSVPEISSSSGSKSGEGESSKFSSEFRKLEFGREFQPNESYPLSEAEILQRPREYVSKYLR